MATKKLGIESQSTDPFHVLLIAIIFDPAKKKILIAKKEKDPELKGLTWFFPGTELHHADNVDKKLKSRIKEKTDLTVKNLGAVFSKVYPERKDYLAVYFLCEAVKGIPRPWKFYKYLKWVNPEELEKKFTTSFHPRLKEYIMNLK